MAFHQYFKISLGCYLTVPSNTEFEGNLGQFKLKHQILSTSELPLLRLAVLIKKSALQPSLPPGVRKRPLEIRIFDPKCIPFLYSYAAHSSDAGTGQDRTQAPLSAGSPNALGLPLGLWAWNKDPSVGPAGWTRGPRQETSAMWKVQTSVASGWRQASAGNPWTCLKVTVPWNIRGFLPHMESSAAPRNDPVRDKGKAVCEVTVRCVCELRVYCYRRRACALPTQIPMLKPKPQCECIWTWGLWKMFRS